MENVTFNLHDLMMGLGGAIGFTTLVGGGYHLWLNSKLANIPKLWKAKDEMVEKIDLDGRTLTERVHGLELRISERYVTKNDFGAAMERLHEQLRALNKKIDRLLESRGPA